MSKITEQITLHYKRPGLAGCFFFFVAIISAQVDSNFHTELRADFDQLLWNLENRYIYFGDKKVDINCIRDSYSDKLSSIGSEREAMLLFEYILDEFYDSHLILNANTGSSYRLYSPIYVEWSEGKAIIKNVWQSEMNALLHYNLIGAEIVEFNGRSFIKAVQDFPTLCHDKSDLDITNWIANKVLAGRYDEPRVFKVRLRSGAFKEIDLDSFKAPEHRDLLHAEKKGEYGYIRIHNSLGNDDLIAAFDKALDSLWATEGLILDLRNTVDGGNSYVAHGVMSRFVDSENPYQKHMSVEQYGAHPIVLRKWVEMVMPRARFYDRPLVVLVGRWTGSMGEGMAVGFDAMNNVVVVGSEMSKLAGAISYCPFSHRDYGCRLATEKLFHIDGTARESFVPSPWQQQNLQQDGLLSIAIEILENNR